MSLSLVDKIFLTIGIIDFGGIFIWMGVCWYLAYTKMDLMLDHLKNCPAIMATASLRREGPLGVLMLVGEISGIFVYPGLYLKRGGMSTEDLDNFPAPLKRKLAILHWCNLVLLLVMLCLGALVMLDVV